MYVRTDVSICMHVCVSYMYAICVCARAEKGKASKCLYPSWSQLPLRRTSYKRILLIYALNILEGCWFTLLGALHDAKTSSTIAVLQHFGSRKLCRKQVLPQKTFVSQETNWIAAIYFLDRTRTIHFLDRSEGLGRT
jgi:hypothetical protein